MKFKYILFLDKIFVESAILALGLVGGFVMESTRGHW